jgi:hypothetical protein
VLHRVLGAGGFPKVTMRYAHLAPEAFREDYGRLGGALPTGDANVIAIATR